VRADSLTAVIIVSDESDCSINSFEWHDLSELSNVNANLACGRHPEYLVPVADIKASLEATKIAAGGEATDLVFAALAGVPMMDECQGSGDQIPDCLDIHPGVNGEGTMAAPDEVARQTSTGVEQYYFEYACQRFEGEVAITSAYPGTSYVQLAQSFGAKGYIYSICNSDWGPAMQNIAGVVQEHARIICLE
ncbi:MAG: hypothetical protein JXX14_11825, partial [Deltaproteobacteria bacterium]|nr:hypothetical protein [Deltaproteobacteria bacterium]